MVPHQYSWQIIKLMKYILITAVIQFMHGLYTVIVQNGRHQTSQMTFIALQYFKYADLNTTLPCMLLHSSYK